MNVSFTGFRNVGVLDKYIGGYAVNSKNNKIVYSPERNVEVDVINVNLTDDYKGKDLTEFYKSAKASSIENYINPVNKEFLNILFIKNSDEDSVGAFFVNGSRLELKDENLPLFSYIARLLRKITTTPKESFVVNKDYLENEDAQNALLPSIDIKKFFVGAYSSFLDKTFLSQDAESIGEKSYDSFIKEAHSYDKVQDTAKNMCDILQNTMLDYLEIVKFNIKNYNIN